MRYLVPLSGLLILLSFETPCLAFLNRKDTPFPSDLSVAHLPTNQVSEALLILVRRYLPNFFSAGRKRDERNKLLAAGFDEFKEFIRERLVAARLEVHNFPFKGAHELLRS